MKLLETNPLDVIKMLYEREETLNKYWNFLIVVSLGLLGFLEAGKGFTSNENMKYIFIISFIVFSISNLVAIISVNKSRVALADLLKDAPELDEVTRSTIPPKKWLLISYHLTFDVMITAAIWLVS